MAAGDVDNGSPGDWPSAGLEVVNPWDLEKGQSEITQVNKKDEIKSSRKIYYTVKIKLTERP